MSLYQSFHRFFAPLNKELKKQGINLNEALIVLALFFENHSKVSPSDLQITLTIPKDQVSQALTKLEKQDLVVRKINPTDSRKRFVVLTAQGKKLAPKLIALFDFCEDQLETYQSTRIEI